jgi:hypothetical protein
MIVPSTGWGGDGLLGLTILFCKIEDISEQAYRLLSVVDGSPASNAGLRANVDFVLGTLRGKFESLEDIRDKAVEHVDKDWLLFVYDAELDVVREVVVKPCSTWWPSHEGGAGILGCEFACGIVHRLPFVVPSSDELEKRVKASMPNRSPAISIYVDPLSPNSTPGASPAPPSFVSPPRVLDLSSSPPPPAAAVLSIAPLKPTESADAVSSSLASASQSSLPFPASAVVSEPIVPASNAAVVADNVRSISDFSEAIRAVDLSSVTSPGRPVLKVPVVEHSSGTAVDEAHDPLPAAAQQPPSLCPSDARVDEKQLFQDVKSVLSPKQFKTFTANMKRLNGGSQAGSVTLSNVSEMLGDHPLLHQQVQLFIKQVSARFSPCFIIVSLTRSYQNEESP